MRDLRALVIQMGARRAYELARMLQERGALSRLDTSAAWAEGSTPFLSRMFPSLDSAIARRTAVGIPRGRLCSTALPEAAGAFAQFFGFRLDRRYALEDWLLGTVSRIRGLGGANVVVNTLGNGGLGFLSWAKGAGAKIATDVFITPLVDELEAAEQEQWPGWESTSMSSSAILANRHRMDGLIQLSDKLLCPSQTVVDGLESFPAFDPAKVVLLPYGLGDFEIALGQPTPRRVFFAGTPGLRKGIPYLALAAKQLRKHDYQIRVAGAVSDTIRARSECTSLIFLGKLSREQVAEEFRKADVFCLPSLAEGMASVTLEALARGVPCVVTRSAGSPVTHGRDGIVIPERSVQDLAQGIRTICEDRSLRSTMSRNALNTARAHHLSSIGDRLYSVLAELARS